MKKTKSTLQKAGRKTLVIYRTPCFFADVIYCICILSQSVVFVNTFCIKACRFRRGNSRRRSILPACPRRPACCFRLSCLPKSNRDYETSLNLYLERRCSPARISHLPGRLCSSPLCGWETSSAELKNSRNRELFNYSSMLSIKSANAVSFFEEISSSKDTVTPSV